ISPVREVGRLLHEGLNVRRRRGRLVYNGAVGRYGILLSGGLRAHLLLLIVQFVCGYRSHCGKRDRDQEERD
ncbi:MAG: hypothetical protein ACREAC_20105, partial [Blastocatellia bacterium]